MSTEKNIEQGMKSFQFSKSILKKQGTIWAGETHTAVICTRDGNNSGKVFIAGKIDVPAALAISKWQDIIAVTGSDYHFVGLTKHGTVVAAGENDNGQCNTGGWRDIVAIAAGLSHTVGLTSKGEVVATGRNDDGQCDTDSWTDIVAIAAGNSDTIGVRKDGTVVVTSAPVKDIRLLDADGNPYYVKMDNSQLISTTSGWRDIVSVSRRGWNIVGLQRNGEIISNSWTYDEEDDEALDRDYWSDLVYISAGESHLVGMQADESIIAQGDNDYGQLDIGSWKNIVAITAGANHTVGLRADGTVLATGDNSKGQCNVSWESLWAQMGKCRSCGGDLSLFLSKCKSCGKKN